MAETKLYQFPISPFAEKTVRALNYKGIAYDSVPIRLSEREENLKVSPTHKFPLLQIDGKSICDSTDIGFYLEERNPDPPLIPADPRLKAQMFILEDWADECLFLSDLALRILWEHNIPAFNLDIFGHEPEHLREPLGREVPERLKNRLVEHGIGRKAKDEILRDAARQMDAVEAMLQGREFLVTDHLTLADLGVFAMFWVIQRAAEGKAMLEERPNITAWRARVDGLTQPGTRFPDQKDGQAAAA